MSEAPHEASSAAPRETLPRKGSEATPYVIFSGTASPDLASQVADHLNMPLGKIAISRFSDGEVKIKVLETVRGKDVYVIQSTCHPDVNSKVMELILLISTMKNASAKSVTAVIPYYAYARQDRKADGRVPISASVMAQMYEAAGVDRVLSIDLHCGQIQGFFRTAVCDNLYGSILALPIIADRASMWDGRHGIVIVSPDAGGVGRARAFQKGLLAKHGIQSEFAMISKERSHVDGSVENMTLIGSVATSICIIVDDMIDTASTLSKASHKLRQCGAHKIYCVASHGVFSGAAIDNIQGSAIDMVYVLNTIPMNGAVGRVTYIPCGSLIAQAIARIQHNVSVSDLFM